MEISIFFGKHIAALKMTSEIGIQMVRAVISFKLREFQRNMKQPTNKMKMTQSYLPLLMLWYLNENSSSLGTIDKHYTLELICECLYWSPCGQSDALRF